MCGIGGVVGSQHDPLRRDGLARMMDMLGHRGPDGRGVFHAGSGGLVHTRLDIIDLETGAQPLRSGSGAALVGNGEIYNYVELNQVGQFPDARTKSDFEPLLQLHDRHGWGALDQLRGMYGVAILDETGRDLLLARDPFGIKPVYYHQGADYFAFASEPQALLCAGYGERRVDAATRAALLNLRYTLGRDTIYPDIKRLLPGEAIRVRDGVVCDSQTRVAVPLPDADQRARLDALARDGDALLRRFDEVFEDSVTVHLRSDVPVGLFLSGGVDSGALLTMASRITGRPPVCYTAGFDSTQIHDERPAARALAESFGAEHIEVVFTEQDFLNDLPAIFACLDDPVIDAAILPTWKLARYAKERFKVVLSGEGGDEIFGGYRRYKRAATPWYLGGKWSRPKGILQRRGIDLPEQARWRELWDDQEREARVPSVSRMTARQRVDIAAWLPNDLLIKLDRTLMAHGVEGRTPFLDAKIAELVFYLPDHCKLHQGKQKYLLRRWLQEHCPAAQAMARKRGFSVPITHWIGLHGAMLGDLLARRASVTDWVSPQRIRSLFTETRSGNVAEPAWIMLFYAVWHAIHIEEADPRQGLAELLAAR